MVNFYCDTLFGEFEVELSPLANSDKQFELLHTTYIVKRNCTIIDFCTKVDSNNYTNVVSSSTNIFVELTKWLMRP
jgi:hypothetical protein